MRAPGASEAGLPETGPASDCFASSGFPAGGSGFPSGFRRWRAEVRARACGRCGRAAQQEARRGVGGSRRRRLGDRDDRLRRRLLGRRQLSVVAGRLLHAGFGAGGVAGRGPCPPSCCACRRKRQASSFASLWRGRGCPCRSPQVPTPGAGALPWARRGGWPTTVCPLGPSSKGASSPAGFWR